MVIHREIKTKNPPQILFLHRLRLHHWSQNETSRNESLKHCSFGSFQWWILMICLQSVSAYLGISVVSHHPTTSERCSDLTAYCRTTFLCGSLTVYTVTLWPQDVCSKGVYIILCIQHLNWTYLPHQLAICTLLLGQFSVHSLLCCPLELYPPKQSV